MKDTGRVMTVGQAASGARDPCARSVLPRRSGRLLDHPFDEGRSERGRTGIATGTTWSGSVASQVLLERLTHHLGGRTAVFASVASEPALEGGRHAGFNLGRGLAWSRRLG